MKKLVRYQNIEAQFLYPFEICEWRNFKLLALEVLDHLPFSKNPGKPSSLKNLEKGIPEHSIEFNELRKFCKKIEAKHVINNKDLNKCIDEVLQKENGHAHSLFKKRLKKLKEEHDDSSDERFFDFTGSVFKESGNKVMFDDSEKKGTRPYLQKSSPHIFITFPGINLTIDNMDSLPNIGTKLNRIKSLPYIRVQTNIKLLASGFGLLKIRCCLFTKEGLEKTVDELVFSSESKSCAGRSDHDKEILSVKINKEIFKAIKYRDNAENPALKNIDEYISQFCHKHCLPTIFIKQSIRNLIERANVLKSSFSTNEIVDIQNLDRGTGWGNEPLFKWSSNGMEYGPESLYKYFDKMINETIINPLRSLSKNKLLKHLPNSRIPDKLYDELTSTISCLKRESSWYVKEGFYPYVLTFVAAPLTFNKPNAKNLREIEVNFTRQINDPENKLRISRLLMKSYWQNLNFETSLNNPIENVFYSDLLYMVVHIRSTLCFYYLPSDPVHEYEKYPQLYNSIKYKRELEDTLVSQRILWYMYTTFNHKVGQEIKSISKTYENLTSHIKKEEFHKILDELTQIIMGIDNRKIAITEVMEDPLSKKGSTLFMDMLSKSSEVFRLKQLYQTLNDQLDRLDMLGLHVNQSTNELSGLVIQETTRATQFTLEILEAFFLAVYSAEIIELAIGKKLEEMEINTMVFFTLAIALPFLALPIISLIRKSMSRFHGRVPVWQEWVERIGFAVGLVMLSGLAWRLSLKFNGAKHGVLEIATLIFFPIIIYWIWFKLDTLHHGE